MPHVIPNIKVRFCDGIAEGFLTLSCILWPSDDIMTGCYGEFLRYAKIARKANIHSIYPLRQYHPFLPALRGRKLGGKSRQRKEYSWDDKTSQ